MTDDRMEEARTRSTHVRLAGLSDMGIVREENQDALLIRQPDDERVLSSRGVLVAVADGMGGLQGGKIASQLAVDTLAGTYFADSGPPPEALREAVREANRVIFRYSREKGSGRSMGSTLTAMALFRDHAYVVSVGDSRAYGYRGRKLGQITEDHSLLRELQTRGHIGKDTRAFQAHRNVLTRGLGLRDTVDVDLFEVADLAVPDTFLLTTDGLHELVEKEEMARAVETHGSDLDGLCRELVEVARERGGPDNITMVAARVEDRPARPGPPPAADRRRETPGGPAAPRPSAWFPALLALAFLAGAATSWIIAGPRGSGARDGLQERVESLLDGDPDGAELRRRVEELLEP